MMREVEGREVSSVEVMLQLFETAGVHLITLRPSTLTERFDTTASQPHLPTFTLSFSDAHGHLMCYYEGQ